jgi:hypothetical protein
MVDAEDFKTTGNAGVVPGIKGSSKEAFPLNKTNRKKEIGRGNRRKMKNLTNKFISAGMALAVLSMTSGLPFGAADALAKPKTNTISAVPTVTHVTVVGGKLVAEGYATATIKGQTYTVPFSGVPVDLTRVSADR